MTRAQQADRDEAREQLRKLLKPGDIVECILRHVSRSGMRREISLYGPGREWLDGYAARALGLRRGKHDGIVMVGCGMDMGFALVYELSHALWPDGFGCIGDDGNGKRCPANDHNNGDRDYTPHCEATACTSDHVTGCACVPVDGPERWRNGPAHWHAAAGGYALRHRWL